MSDPRWQLLQEAKPALLRVGAERGVVRIEFVSAFPSSDRIVVWLGTETDRQRDSLGVDDPLLDEVRSVLVRTGFAPEQLNDLMTTAQSQETVDRDYAGSWFYALR